MIRIMPVLTAMFLILFFHISSFSSTTQIDDFNKITSEYFAPLDQQKFSQQDIEDLFDYINEGIIRFQIVDNEIYFFEKKYYLLLSV